MIINSLNIKGFGKFQDKTINFTDGLNVVYGKNEAGKSTIHTFIKSMLFGMKKKKVKNQIDTYTKYLPWEKLNSYEGFLSFSYNRKKYQIHRIFSLTNPLLEVYEIGKKPIDNPELFLNKVLYNLTIEAFDNTISISQMKNAQDSSLVQDLHRYISNLNTSGSMSINTIAALNNLKHQKEDLSLNINSNATILYNKQLGNIKNLEKEISNEEFDNHLPEILAMKQQEDDEIELNNEKIEKLRQDIGTNQVSLEQYGFNSREDIVSLNTQTDKIFFEYKPIMDGYKNTQKTIRNILSILFGICIITFSTLVAVVTYPQIASILKLNNINYSLNTLTDFVINLPFHPVMLIGFLCCTGIILIAWNIILLFDNYQNFNRAKEMKDILADIFNQHINDDEVNEENMALFKKHIKDMRKIADDISDKEAKIVALTKTNNDLLSKKEEYDRLIAEQQKVQYNVEQKYNELNALRVENEKLKNNLATNDIISREIESIDMAIDTLTTLSDEIQVMFGTHLNKTASTHIYGLTNGRYDSLNVDNSLNITINDNNKVISLLNVSTGTADQIYLAMRLATTDIICNNKETLPLIFDECFAMYDNERLEASLKYLNKAISNQIIIFTCQTRERGLLLHNNIDFNSQEI